MIVSGAPTARARAIPFPSGPLTISGALRYRRDELVDVQVASWTAGFGIFAAVGGALLVDVIPGDGHPLMLLTAVLIAFSAYRLGRPPADESPADLTVEGMTDAGPSAEVVRVG